MSSRLCFHKCLEPMERKRRRSLKLLKIAKERKDSSDKSNTSVPMSGLKAKQSENPKMVSTMMPVAVVFAFLTALSIWALSTAEGLTNSQPLCFRPLVTVSEYTYIRRSTLYVHKFIFRWRSLNSFSVVIRMDHSSFNWSWSFALFFRWEYLRCKMAGCF